jgi:general secretion pathway protein C
MSNGHPNGFKLYAIRPTSMLAALHFKNGDTIMLVNGEDLSTGGSQSLDVYTRLKSAKHFVIDMLRRGSPMTMTIDVK